MISVSKTTSSASSHAMALIALWTRFEPGRQATGVKYRRILIVRRYTRKSMI